MIILLIFYLAIVVGGSLAATIYIAVMAKKAQQESNLVTPESEARLQELRNSRCAKG